MKCSIYSTEWEINQIELAIKYHQLAINNSIDLDDKVIHFGKLSELKTNLNQLKARQKNERSANRDLVR